MIGVETSFDLRACPHPGAENPHPARTPEAFPVGLPGTLPRDCGRAVGHGWNSPMPRKRVGATLPRKEVLRMSTEGLPYRLPTKKGRAWWFCRRLARELGSGLAAASAVPSSAGASWGDSGGSWACFRTCRRRPRTRRDLPAWREGAHRLRCSLALDRPGLPARRAPHPPQLSSKRAAAEESSSRSAPRAAPRRSRTVRALRGSTAGASA